MLNSMRALGLEEHGGVSISVSICDDSIEGLSFLSATETERMGFRQDS